MWKVIRIVKAQPRLFMCVLKCQQVISRLLSNGSCATELSASRKWVTSEASEILIRASFKRWGVAATRRRIWRSQQVDCSVLHTMFSITTWVSFESNTSWLVEEWTPFDKLMTFKDCQRKTPFNIRHTTMVIPNNISIISENWLCSICQQIAHKSAKATVNVLLTCAVGLVLCFFLHDASMSEWKAQSKMTIPSVHWTISHLNKLQGVLTAF